MPLTASKIKPAALFLTIAIFLSMISVSGAQYISGNPHRSLYETPTPDVTEYKNAIEQLKNKRDTEVAALIRQRDLQIKSLLDGLEFLRQSEIVKAKRETAILEQKIAQGQDPTGSQRILMQIDENLAQRTAEVQEQIIKLEASYNQKIQELVDAYTQVFENLQQEFINQH